MISGKYDFSLDAKNRVFVPAKLRDALGDQIVMVKGIDECISVYPLAGWESFCAKLEALPKPKFAMSNDFYMLLPLNARLMGRAG